MTFDNATRALLDGRNFAIVATLNADGEPQSSVVWVKRDGDTLLFSTTAGRLKARNLARDPRVSVCILETENPYHYVEIRGTAELAKDEGKKLQREINHKYTGEDPPVESDDVVRLIVRVIPEKIVVFSV